MKKITYRIVFNRKKKLNKNGKGIIQIECYLNSQRKYISTGIYIEPKDWNVKTNNVKNTHPDFANLNRMILSQVKSIEDYEFKQYEKNGSFSLNEINVNTKRKSDSFIDFCEKSLKENKTISNETIRHHRVTITKLKHYFPNLTFNNINYSTVKKFNDLLILEGLHINTIANQHKVFKVYINLAIKMNLLEEKDYPYKSFKVKKIQTKRIFLTTEEIEVVAGLKFTDSTKGIELVRDMFLFSCYTGLRYGDVQKLTNRNIKIENGEMYIEIRMNKTKDFVKIPVSLLFKGKAIDVINKYREDFPEKFLFPRKTKNGLSNQDANRKLKLIELISKIDKNLSFHVSRHTFGTNLAAATSDPFLVKELMGHSDIKTSMIYIHTSQEQIKNKLKDINWD